MLSGDSEADGLENTWWFQTRKVQCFCFVQPPGGRLLRVCKTKLLSLKFKTEMENWKWIARSWTERSVHIGRAHGRITFLWEGGKKNELQETKAYVPLSWWIVFHVLFIFLNVSLIISLALMVGRRGFQWVGFVNYNCWKVQTLIQFWVI